MAQFPWSTKIPVEADRVYVVMASRLPLKRFRSVPGFLSATSAIRHQLADTAGLVGYALLAELGAKTFWTFSAWEDRARLDAFARSEPHARVIGSLAAKMGPTRFSFSEAPGSRLPWSWQDVKSALDAAR